jgi:cytosine deaminase
MEEVKQAALLPVAPTLRSGKLNRPVQYRFFRRSNILALRGNCSISSNDILNPFTPFGGGSLIRMANLHANILQIGQPERMPELFAMILARSARAHEPRRLRPESQQSRRCRDH